MIESLISMRHSHTIFLTLQLPFILRINSPVLQHPSARSFYRLQHIQNRHQFRFWIPRQLASHRFPALHKRADQRLQRRIHLRQCSETATRNPSSCPPVEAELPTRGLSRPVETSPPRRLFKHHSHPIASR